MSLTDEQMHERMAKGWRMGRPFTDCGNGSTLEATRNVRAWLPAMVLKYDIHTVIDAGAGDMAWVRHIDWHVDYRPYDLIPRALGVIKWDISSSVLPRADLILCRMVLNHIQERIDQTLHMLRLSGSSYLAATQYDAGPTRTRQFARLDLRPWLGEPLERVKDGLDEGCEMALWELI